MTTPVAAAATKTTPSGKTVQTAPGSHPPLRKTPVASQTYRQGRPHTSSSPSSSSSSSGSSGSSGKTPSRSGRAARAASSAHGQFASPEFREYQGIILVEFVLAELLVAGTPIAVRKNEPGLSPYIGRDMVKMLSLGLVYFLLELTAVGGGKMGRLGAWFGLLVLLGVGLNEGANVARVFNLFGAGLAKASGANDQGSTNG